jgi:glycosyltransferase involved in cell wall biosynthesis
VTPVLWATQVYPRFAGDVLGAFLHRLARELPSRGFQPVVVAPAADGVPGEETRDGVRIVRFRYAAEGRQSLAYRGAMHRRALRSPATFLSFLRSFRCALLSAAEDLHPAILHAHWWAPSGWVSAGVSSKLGVPLALSLHGTDIRLAKSVAVLRPLARRVIRKADLVLPVSPSLGRGVREIAGDVRLEVLAMPADTDVFGGRPPAEPSAPPHFAAVARLTAQKRIDVAIRALSHLRESGVAAVLEIAGDGPERGRLEELARQLGVNESVVFLGMLTPERVADLFHRCGALVFPAEEEGYGLVIVEAALCGVPTLGVRSGGLLDLVESGANGVLVDPGDAKALSEAMARLARDASAGRAMGLRAQERARSGSPKQVADRLAALYRGLTRGAAS